MGQVRFANQARIGGELPEGVLVDTVWLREHGYSRQLLSHDVRAGWLHQPARGVYRRPRGPLSWRQLVVSLQTLLDYPLAVGGRTALELLGYTHYLSHKESQVHLNGPKPPPAGSITSSWTFNSNITTTNGCSKTIRYRRKSKNWPVLQPTPETL